MRCVSCVLGISLSVSFCAGVAGAQQAPAEPRPTLQALQERNDDIGRRLQGLAAECTPGVLEARAALGARIRARIAAVNDGTLLDDVLTLVSQREQADMRCCAEVTLAAQDQRLIRDGLAAIASDVAASEQLLSQRSALDAQVQQLTARVALLQQQADAIDTGNQENIVAVLGGSGFFDTSSIAEVLDRYLRDPAFRVRVEQVEMFITPFGYFSYEPVVTLSGGGTRTELVFHPLDFFGHDRILQTYRAVVGRQRVSLSASYEPDADWLVVEPSGPIARDIDFGSEVPWQWALRRTHVLRLIRATSPAQIQLEAASGQSGPRPVPSITTSVESDGRLTRAWEWVEALGTLYGLVPLATGLLGFIAGRASRTET